MNVTILILLLGITLIVAGLIYKAKSDARKQLLKIEKEVADAASNNNLAWTHKEISKHRAIAWCADKATLFFVNLSGGKQQKFLVDMNEAKKCSIVERALSSGSGKGEKYISRVELEIVFPDKPAICLPMYNEIDDGVFERAGLTDKAIKWQALIQQKQKEVQL